MDWVHLDNDDNLPVSWSIPVAVSGKVTYSQVLGVRTWAPWGC